MGRETRFDALARDLASGEVSRRSALKRLAGIGLGLGAAIAPAGVADAMGGGCPPGRVKCDGRCCPKNARCRNGRCRCKPGFKKCGRKCVNLDTSIKHCGACGTACALGQTCVDGVCTAPPSCADAVKNGQETDVDCGGPTCAKCADGKACLTGSDCQSGVCAGNVCVAATCADGFKNGQETDVDCGGGTCPGCTSGQACLAGSDCQSGCCSNSVCRDTQTDPNNCGACGQACSANNMTSVTCSGGVCTGVCSPGFGDCNANKLTDGCEQSLNSINHCGACNQVCSAPNATVGCSGGACVLLACDAGFYDCDGQFSTGCESTTPVC
ncbi:MAG: hypothetical protein ACR2G3_07060 [Solirubrobacterales bacterium]